MSLRDRWHRFRHAPSRNATENHALRAVDSLRKLLDDPSIPAAIRRDMAAEYQHIEALLDKLEQGHIHLAVFGRVSVGKSALLNALLGEEAFPVDVLHGTTQHAHYQEWQSAQSQGVHLIDTPGINELSGEDRETLAFEVAERSDLILFVVDGDLTHTEAEALQLLAQQQRPLLLILNKRDRYTRPQREALLQRMQEHAKGLISPENIIAVQALPSVQRVIKVQADGQEIEEERTQPVDIQPLRERITTILETEGKTLSALNAALFAGQLSDQIGQRLTELQRELSQRIIRFYCLAKGIAVALNPIPVADLLAAVTLDVALVMHLSRIHNLPLTRTEASKLLTTIATQLAALMGAIWGVHLVSSALKVASIGLSTAVTAVAQGALAWYATILVGQAAEKYLAQGKSWGEHGPKQVVADIIATLDRDSILREAREEILARLKTTAPSR